MPGRVFHIIRIHRAMRFELFAAVFVSPRIVERNPALPELGRIARNQLYDLVKPLHSLSDAVLLEIGYGAIHDLARLFVRALSERGESEDTEQGRSGHRVINIPFSGANSIGQPRPASNMERFGAAVMKLIQSS